MNLRPYISLVVFLCLFVVTESGYAKILTCEAYKGDGKGWIPESFVVDLSEDRAKATIIDPIRDSFGAKPFEKAIFGSALWSRGKGKSKRGDYYNYQFQLIFENSDTNASIELTMHQYHPLKLYFNCRAGRGVGADPSSVYTPQKRVSNADIARQASDSNLCIYAVRQEGGETVWDLGKGADDFVREAQKRGLTCGVSSTNAVPSANKQKKDSDLKSKLLEAKDLFDSGLISEDEYEKLKKRLLGL
mgnify:CR=1 FL=1